MYQIKDGWMVFDDRFNEPLTNVVFPTGIQKVKFGRYFNQEIRNLPNSITHLSFEYWGYFNQNISQLPNSLTHLTFDYDFNQEVRNLPNGLIHLSFGYCFNQDMSKLPKSLTYLCFYGWSSCNNSNINPSLNPYLYHLTEFVINQKHKHKRLMLKRCQINQHNRGIREDKLIDLLLKN